MLLRWEDGLRERLMMVVSEGQLDCRIPPATRGFTYQVLAGDAESPIYRVRLVEPPRVAGVQMRITPPAYTGQASRLQTGGDATIVAGSMVSMQARISGGRVVVASLEGDGPAAASVLPSPDGQGQLVRASLLAQKDRAWWWRLTGEDGIAGETPERWHLAVVADAPPDVHLQGPAAFAPLIASDGRLPLTISASDDLGLRSLSLIITTASGSEHRSLALANLARSSSTSMVLELGDWHLAEGEVLGLQAEAEDCGGPVHPLQRARDHHRLACRRRCRPAGQRPRPVAPAPGIGGHAVLVPVAGLGHAPARRVRGGSGHPTG